jgi:hypothetical protein
MESGNTEHRSLIVDDRCCHRQVKLCQNPTSNSERRKRESMKNFVAYQSFASIFSIDGTYICGACYTFWSKKNKIELTNEQLKAIGGKIN